LFCYGLLASPSHFYGLGKLSFAPTIKNRPYVDESGRYADFHSLRHTSVSLLAASCAHPKIAQTLMRHCGINLTMNCYTHSYRGQLNEAIAKLPVLALPSSKSQKSAATGTDGKALENDSGAYKPACKK
jgi:hypothetical protein